LFVSCPALVALFSFFKRKKKRKREEEEEEEEKEKKLEPQIPGLDKKDITVFGHIFCICRLI